MKFASAVAKTVLHSLIAIFPTYVLAQPNTAEIAQVFIADKVRQQLLADWGRTDDALPCAAWMAPSALGKKLAGVVASDFSASEFQEALDFLGSGPGQRYADRQRNLSPVSSRTEADLDAERQFFNTPLGLKLLDRLTIQKYAEIAKGQFKADSPECKAALEPVPGVRHVAEVNLTDLACTLPRVTYPAAARRQNQSGTVLVRLLADESGLVRFAGIRRSSGFASLDKAAQFAVLSMRCRPYQTADGKLHKVTAIQPIAFALDSTQTSKKGDDLTIESASSPPRQTLDDRRAALARLQSLVAGASAGTVAPGTIEDFASAVRDQVRPFIAYGGALEDLERNPKVVVRVFIDSEGNVLQVRTEEVSDNPVWNSTVLRAIRNASPLPVPPKGQRTDFTITFRPKE
ncbi:TonB family protein [Cupriavidus basilensis]|uniref:TonB family protein n=1 Tax=Cupriavidus basilensis TaxID=68895 RepID=A0ABT6AP39_9BURK|nr:TonB family protein [Cupriavidus basilensis]MDF3834057.1 TonB family protein [Cupriavidus basilensis]